MIYAITIYKEGQEINDSVWTDSRPPYNIRNDLLLSGFVMQLDRDGFEFYNPMTAETVTIT
jgi:hypothetical protein